MRREATIALLSVLALTLVGLLTVYSASTARAFAELGPDKERMFDALYRQGVHVGLGLFALFVFARTNYRLLQHKLLLAPMVVCVLTLLILVLLVGEEVRGGRRWIQIAGWSFQPSELAKLGAIVMFAAYLAAVRERIRNLGTIAIYGAAAGVLMLLVLLEQDLGTPVVLGTVALAMAFMAGARWGHVAVGVSGAAAAVYVLIISEDYRRTRLLAFTDPWQYRDDEAYQLIQSMVAFVRGGIWGQGPGASEQKLLYLPDAHTDFAFAIWAEEMGLVGTLAVALAFAVFLIVALRIALCAPDLFGALLAAGITTLITVQAVFNMAVTTGLMPTKGLPLPFISAGGTALIVNLALVGILINVGLQSTERKRPVVAASEMTPARP